MCHVTHDLHVLKVFISNTTQNRTKLSVIKHPLIFSFASENALGVIDDLTPFEGIYLEMAVVFLS